MMLGRARSFALLVALLGSGTAARAQAPAPLTPEKQREMERLFKEGFDACQSDKRYGEGLAKLEIVAEHKDTASLHYALGACKEGLGQLPEALREYFAAEKRAAADAAKVDVKEAADKKIADLKKRVPILRLRVTGDAAHEPQVVLLDGHEVAPDQFETPQALSKGAHRIEARRAGFRSFFETWDAAPGPEHIVEILLNAEAPSGRAGDALREEGGRGRPTEASESAVNTPAIVALGAGAVLAAAGTAMFFVASGKQSDARKTCAASTLPTCDESQGSIRAFDTLAIAGWALGAAGIGASAYFFFRTPNRVSSGVYWSPAGVGYQRNF